MSQMPPVQPPYTTWQMIPPIPVPPQKSNPWKWIVIGISSFSGLVLLSCCGFFALAASSHGNTTTTTAHQNMSTKNGTSTATPKSSMAHVGDAIAVDGVSVTLVSVAKLGSDEYNQPKAGNIYIVAHIKIANHSDGIHSYNPLDFQIKSGKGNISSNDWSTPSTYTANNELSSGNLAIEGSIEGDIIFQIPQNDHKAALLWEDNAFWNPSDARGWNIGL